VQGATEVEQDERFAAREYTQTLQADIEEYQRHIEGISCPPECPNFSLLKINETGSPCILEEASPRDCSLAESGDLARWLVAKGWIKPSIVKHEQAPRVRVSIRKRRLDE
jgi:hypothetical protein